MHLLAIVSLLLVAAGAAWGNPPSKRFFFPLLITPTCGSTSRSLTANSSATIQSPNYPSNYPNNYCNQWNFSCPKNMTLSCPEIRIVTFLCMGDVLEVYVNRAWKGNTCGKTDLNYAVPANGTLLIKFRTDWLFTAQGFRCTVSCAA